MKRITLSLKKYAYNLTYSSVLCFLFFASNQLNAQVGINNTDPKASLDITSTDPSDPENTDGLLVPRVSAFPTSDPGVDQNGMLLYLTTTVGLNTPGFYYWNQATSTWLKFTDSSVNTSDADFYEEGTTTAPDNINDDIYTQGNVAIGKTTADYKLDVNESSEARTINILNETDANSVGVISGIYNEVSGNMANPQRGIYNVLSGTGNNVQRGIFNRISGAGSGSKFGSYNLMDTSAGGTHYGVYSTALKSGSFAGFFRGKVSIGTTQHGSGPSDHYILPSSRGTVNQVMQADGGGNVGWVDALSIGVQKINDLSDGKSDNDGSGDGSSIFLGINAGLVDDATDNKNISIGHSSLASNVTGQRNVAIGYYALNMIASGDGNTVIGAYAMRNSTLGQGNVAIGQYTLENSNGLSNNAVGNYALQDNSTGAFNNAFGVGALNDNMTGYDNNAFGYTSLNENVSGSVNNAFGSYALQRNKGSENNAFGTSSLRQNSDGSNNSAFGSESLTSNLTGNFNSSFGSNSSNDNETGSYNATIGVNSLHENMAGNYNATLGFNSGYYVLGSNNVFLGTSAGRGSSNHSKSGSVMIGYSAGYNEITSNKLYIENSSAGANNALIYGEFDNNIFRINGELQLGLTSAGRYAFPTADGTVNQILQTDGNGNVSWSTISFSDATTASNGLTLSGDDVKLGGTLTQSTTITQSTNNFTHNLNSTGDFFIQDAGTNVFEIRDSGLILFGRDTYWRDENTAGTNIATLINDGNDGRFRIYENGSTSVDLDANTGFVFNEQGLDRNFRIEGDSRNNIFFIDASTDRIGIGDSSPTYDVQLKQSEDTHGGTGGIGFESSSSTNKWKIYHSGTHFSFAENGTRRAYITGATGVYVVTSDRRLKKSITEVESMLSKVNNLKPYRYIYKDQDNSAKKTIGFMAQDVQKLFPELVETGEGGFLGLNYAGFSVIAIKALQEQQTEIELLKKENETLKEKQKSLEERFQNIERYLKK